MPVALDSASRNIKEVAGTATSGDVAQNHIINPSAPAVTALLFAYLAANVDASTAVLSATFGTDAVDMAMLGDPLYFDGNKNALAVFSLAAPATGPQQWEASVSGLTANANGFWLLVDCVSYSGVLSVGEPVAVSGDTAGAQTANSVTIDSISPAHRVVTGHAVRSPHLFSAYNLTTRAAIDGQYAYIAYLLSFFGYNFIPYTATATGGELLVGDAPGAATVTGTATQPSTAAWGAVGVPLIPAPVIIEAALGIPTSVDVAASLHRVATPSPLRTWVIGDSQ